MMMRGIAEERERKKKKTDMKMRKNKLEGCDYEEE